MPTYWDDILYLVVFAVIAWITAMSFQDWRRLQDRWRLELAAAFLLLALMLALSAKPVWTLVPWLVTPAVMVIFPQPLLILQMIRQFRPVPGWILNSALPLFLVSEAAVLVWMPQGELQKGSAPWYVVACIMLYFMPVMIGAISLLVSEAARTGGASRSRLMLASVGTVSFMAAYAVSFLLLGAGFRTAADMAFLVFITLCAAGYYLGFASPYWLRRVWRALEAEHFLRTLARRGANHGKMVVQHLLESSLKAAGGKWAVFLRVGTDGTSLAPEAHVSVRALEPKALAAASVLGRRVCDKSDLDAARLIRLQEAEAESLMAPACLVVPVSSGTAHHGLLVTFLPHVPLFAEDDAALLQFMADQAGVVEEIQEMVAIKHRFLSEIAHDLRTPMSAVLGNVEYLKDDLTGDAALLAELAHRNAYTMNDMIEGLLELARLETRDIPFQGVPIDVITLIRNWLPTVRAQIEDRGMTLDVSISPDARAVALVEPQSINRVLENFRTNAEKYAAGGGWLGISVAVTAESVRVEFADSGPGVAPEDLHSLFQYGFRSHEVRTGRTPGSGIGLAIVRETLARHGGTVGAFNRAEGGLCMWFELPLSPPSGT